MRAAREGALLLGLVLGGGARAGAQGPDATPLPPTPELRADVITGRTRAVQIGAGVQLPIGYYVRVGAVAAAGARYDASATAAPGAVGRVDVAARFLLDPFRQSRVGASVGGGLSVLAAPGDRARPLLLLLLDLEGRRTARGLVPAVQIGVGGGVRLGIALRAGAERVR